MLAQLKELLLLRLSRLLSRKYFQDALQEFLVEQGGMGSGEYENELC